MGRPYSVYCGAANVLSEGVFQWIHVDPKYTGVNEVYEWGVMLLVVKFTKEFTKKKHVMLQSLTPRLCCGENFFSPPKNQTISFPLY